MSGCLIGPKTWDRIVGIFREFLEPIWTVCDCVGAVWGVCFIIYEINCVYAIGDDIVNCSSEQIWVMVDQY